MEEKDPLSFIGGRKFVVALLLLGVGAGLTFAKTMGVDQFIELAKWVMGIYVAGNVGTKMVTQ